MSAPFHMPTEVEKLAHGVEQGDTELVRSMLASGRFNVNRDISAGYTLMHLAVQRGRLEIVQLLSAHEAAVNSRGDDGCTPIFMVPMAPASVQVRLYELLVKLGASPHAVNNQKLSARKYLRLLGTDPLVNHLGGRLTDLTDSESSPTQPALTDTEDKEAEVFRARYHQLVDERVADWLADEQERDVSSLGGLADFGDPVVPRDVREQIEQDCQRRIQQEWRTYLHQRDHPDDDDDGSPDSWMQSVR